MHLIVLVLKPWIPASAGMTVGGAEKGQYFTRQCKVSPANSGTTSESPSG